MGIMCVKRLAVIGALLEVLVFLALLLRINATTGDINARMNTIQEKVDSINIKADSLKEEVRLLNCYLYD